MLSSKLHEKEEENARLDRQLKDLRAAVEARQAIYRTRVSNDRQDTWPARQTGREWRWWW